jgi:hypothetical protein
VIWIRWVHHGTHSYFYDVNFLTWILKLNVNYMLPQAHPPTPMKFPGARPLKVPSSCLHLLPRLLVPSSFPSTFPSIPFWRCVTVYKTVTCTCVSDTSAAHRCRLMSNNKQSAAVLSMWLMVLHRVRSNLSYYFVALFASDLLHEQILLK